MLSTDSVRIRPVVYVRYMNRKDFPESARMDAEVFEFPWNEFDFARFNKERSQIGLVAMLNNELVGYVLYGLEEKEVRLVRLAVAAHYQRLGIGTQIMDRIMNKTSIERRDRVILEIRETNLRGQLFFRSCGFRATGVLWGFYDDTCEDAYVMEYKIHSAFPRNRISEFL